MAKHTYAATELRALHTLSIGQADDLKIETYDRWVVVETYHG